MTRAVFRSSNAQKGLVIHSDAGNLYIGQRRANQLLTRQSNVDRVNNDLAARDAIPVPNPFRRKRAITGGNVVFGVFRVRVDEGFGLICPGYICGSEGLCEEVASGGDTLENCEPTCGDNPDENPETGCMRKLVYYFGSTTGLPFPWDIPLACTSTPSSGNWTREGLQNELAGGPNLVNRISLQGQSPLGGIDFYNSRYIGAMPQIPLGVYAPSFPSFFTSFADTFFDTLIGAKYEALYGSFDETIYGADPVCYPTNQTPPVGATGIAANTKVQFRGVATCPNTTTVLQAFARAPRTWWRAAPFIGQNFVEVSSGTELIPTSNWGFVSIVTDACGADEGDLPGIPTVLTDLFDYTAQKVFDSDEDCGADPDDNAWAGNPRPDEDDFGYRYYFFSNQITEFVEIDPAGFDVDELIDFYVVPSGRNTPGIMYVRGGGEDVMGDLLRCRQFANTDFDNEMNPIITRDVFNQEDRPEALASNPEINWLDPLFNDYRDDATVLDELGDCYEAYAGSYSVQAPPEDDGSGNLEFGDVYRMLGTNENTNGDTVSDLLLSGDNLTGIELEVDVNVVQASAGTCSADSTGDPFVASFPGLGNGGIQQFLDDNFPGIDVEDPAEFDFVRIGVIIG